MNSLVSALDVVGLAPELLLCGAGVVILLLEAFLPWTRRATIPLAVLSTIAAGGFAWWSQARAPGEVFQGLLEWSPVTLFLAQVVLISALLCLLASGSYLRREGLEGGEYPALLLWSASGALLLLRSTDLLTIFLALELMSICLYALAGYHRRSGLSLEAAVKYFLMGAFVSSFLLLGIALVWGETGSTSLLGIAGALEAGKGAPKVLTLGFLLILVSFGFKMSLVPFHAWAPDVYQGAPSPFVAFLAVAPKAASALVLIRVLDTLGAGAFTDKWPQLIALLAVLSMLTGNLLALAQKDIKRMLAYSGIAHMGYLLIPLVALDQASMPPVLTYLLAYALMTGGAFVVVTLLFARPGEQHLISELSGWGYRYPFLAFCLTICLLSLAGIPPTLGFLGKYLVFAYAIQSGQLTLALVGIAAALIGVFYYLRVIYVLYMKPEVMEPEGLVLDLPGRTAAFLAAAGTLVLGIFPGPLLDWLRQMIEGL